MAISVACRINAPINIKQAGGGGGGEAGRQDMGGGFDCLFWPGGGAFD